MFFDESLIIVANLASFPKWTITKVRKSELRFWSELEAKLSKLSLFSKLFALKSPMCRLLCKKPYLRTAAKSPVRGSA